MNSLSLPLTALALLAPLLAQDPVPETAPAAATEAPDPAAQAAAALRAVDSTAFQFTGAVSRKQAKAEDGPAGLGVAIMVGSSATGGGEPFKGAFVGHRYDGEDDVIVCSEKRLPGFRAWLGARKIIETLSDGGATNAQGPLNELSSLLDFGRFQRYVKRAEWKATPGPDGTTTLRAELPGKVIETEDSNGMGRAMRFGNKVLRVETELVVDAEGWLQAATYSIVRNDPMAAIREQIVQGGGGGNVAFTFDGTEDGEPADGEVTTWNLKFAEGAPLEPVAEFRKVVSSYLDAEDF